MVTFSVGNCTRSDSVNALAAALDIIKSFVTPGSTSVRPLAF